MALDYGTITDPIQREKTLSTFMAPHELHLRVGCQVMLIKNRNSDLVNGSMGKLLGFCEPHNFYGVKTNEDGQEEIIRSQPDDEPERTSNMASFETSECPIVAFKLPGKPEPRYVLLEKETWAHVLPSGEVLVSRTQVSIIHLMNRQPNS